MRPAPLICVVALALGCGIEPAITTPETYTDFLKLSSQLTCEASLRCCGTPCSPSTDAGFYRASARQVDFIAQGLMTYDRQAAIDCLAALKARYTSCDARVNTLPPSTACNSVVLPKAPVGSSCESPVPVCGPDSTCSNNTCTVRQAFSSACSIAVGYCTSQSDTCCITCSGLGTCVPFLKLGQTCSPGSSQMQCAPGTYCPSVAPQVCTAAGEQGQSCSATPATACNVTKGLVCLSSLTCGPPQPDGSPCSSNAQCTSGSCFLSQLPMTTVGTCQAQIAPPSVRQQLCPGR